MESKAISKDLIKNQLAYPIKSTYILFQVCLAVSLHKNETLLLVSQNETILMFELTNLNSKFKLLYKLKKHIRIITCLQFMDKNKQFVSGSQDGVIIIWDQDKQQNCIELQSPWGSGQRINCLQLNYEGNILISGNNKNEIKFWIKKEFWKCETTFKVLYECISCMSLNQSETRLIVLGVQKLGSVIEVINMKTIQIESRIYEDYGHKIQFITDDKFTFVPYNKEHIAIYVFDSNINKFRKQITQSIQNKQDQLSLKQKLQSNEVIVISKNKYTYIIHAENNPEILHSVEYATKAHLENVSKDFKLIVSLEGDFKFCLIQLRKLIFL